MVNSEYLDDVIKKSGIAKWKIADQMEMSRQNLYKKVHNQVPFNVDEAKKLMAILDLDIEKEFIPIFFAQLMHKPSISLLPSGVILLENIDASEFENINFLKTIQLCEKHF